MRVLKRANSDSEGIARGLGLGLFVGFLPSIGFQIVLALFLAKVLRANHIIAALGTLVTNPLTTLPITAFSIWIGDLLLVSQSLGQGAKIEPSLEFLLNNPGQIGLAFLTGCLALSLVSGILGYSGVRFYYWRKNSLSSKTSGGPI